MSAAIDIRARTPTEIKAVYKVIESAVKDALIMSLKTPAAQRALEMIALHASIPDRLMAEGVEPERAVCLARGIRVTVEVAADDN